MTQKFPITALTLAEIKEKGFRRVLNNPVADEPHVISDAPLPEFDGKIQIKIEERNPDREEHLEIDAIGEEMVLVTEIFEKGDNHWDGNEINSIATLHEYIDIDFHKDKWNWRLEEIKNAKQAKSLFRFFLLLGLGIALSVGLSILLK